MEPRKLGKPIDYRSGMCMGNLNSQNALHVESAKQLFIMIFIPVVEHTPTLSSRVQPPILAIAHIAKFGDQMLTIIFIF